jgi:hypothetical protein
MAGWDLQDGVHEDSVLLDEFDGEWSLEGIDEPNESDDNASEEETVSSHDEIVEDPGDRHGCGVS